MSEPEVEAPPAGLIAYVARNEKSLAWAWRAGTALVCFALSSHFLSKDDYNKDQAARAADDKALAVTLTKLDGTLNRYEDMHDTLKDHESRLRALERNPRP